MTAPCSDRSPSVSEYVFVYGSLRRAAQHPMHRVLKHYAQYVDPACMQGYLYAVADYPGAVASSAPHAKVYGEVYQVLQPDLLFTALDAYEECSAAFAQPHEYSRQQLAVTLATGTRIMAWVYVYNRAVSDFRLIAGGDYLNAIQVE